MMVESFCSVVVEHPYSGFAETHAPLYILPPVEGGVFPERNIFCHGSRKTDVAGVGETVLSFLGDESHSIWLQLRVLKLPARFLKPAHDRRDAQGGVPCGVAQNGSGSVVGILIARCKTVNDKMCFTCIFLQENVVAKEETSGCLCFLYPTISCRALVCFAYLQEFYRHAPGRSIEKFGSAVIVAVAHDDHLYFVHSGLLLQVPDALLQNIGTSVRGDDNRKFRQRMHAM